jgi:sulfotransferase family protein
MKSRKVFCLGLQKTGTSSLGMALERLGYNVVGYNPFRHLAKKDDLTWQDIEKIALKVASNADAVQDTPWPTLFQQLDVAFPGSCFIHVIRNRDAWIKSAVNDFQSFPNEIHRLIYGSAYPEGNEVEWLARYDQHNKDVSDYFAERPEDFLQLNLDEFQVNWENVCPFLGETVPDMAWPHANQRRTKQFKMKYNRVLSRLGLK